MIKHLLNRLAAKIPRELPTNKEAMDAYLTDILSVYNLPLNHEYKRALAKMVHGVSQSAHKVPKSYFYSHLRRYEAMMAAVQMVTELEKQKQAATQKPVEPLPDPKVEV